MADIAWWRVSTTTPPNTTVYRANHFDVADDFSALGQNVMFSDGHVEWQVPSLGKSWKYYGSLYVNSNMWLTSNYAPPEAPNVYYFN